jgi:ribosomal protein S6--L-glutamate ligase
MKIAVLSRSERLYWTRRLREAAESRGHECEVIDYLRCYMTLVSGAPTLDFGGRVLDDVDGVIPRIGASKTFYGTAVVRQFEMMNILTANASRGITFSRDKLRCLQALSKADVGVPRTAFAHSPKDVDEIIKAVGGAPLIVKILEGTQGMGVVLAESRKAAQSVIEAFRQLEAYILVQEFVESSKGTDLRAFVVGDQVVAAMKREASEGEFRANVHRGGSASVATLSDEEVDTALRAARVVGLDVCGVDLLRSDRGPLVLEVNSSPGLQGIESATGVDVAGAIIERLETRRSENP